MAAVTASVLDNAVVIGTHQHAAGGIKRLTVMLMVTNGATAVVGGTDTLDVNVATAVAAKLRTGATYTLRDWCVAQGGRNSSDVEYVATGTVSGNTISLTPKTPADWSTNATIAASALQVPIGLIVVVDVT